LTSSLQLKMDSRILVLPMMLFQFFAEPNVSSLFFFDFYLLRALLLSPKACDLKPYLLTKKKKLRRIANLHIFRQRSNIFLLVLHQPKFTVTLLDDITSISKTNTHINFDQISESSPSSCPTMLKIALWHAHDNSVS